MLEHPLSQPQSEPNAEPQSAAEINDFDHGMRLSLPREQYRQFLQGLFSAAPERGSIVHCYSFRAGCTLLSLATRVDAALDLTHPKRLIAFVDMPGYSARGRALFERDAEALINQPNSLEAATAVTNLRLERDPQSDEEYWQRGLLALLSTMRRERGIPIDVRVIGLSEGQPEMETAKAGERCQQRYNEYHSRSVGEMSGKQEEMLERMREVLENYAKLQAASISAINRSLSARSGLLTEETLGISFLSLCAPSVPGASVEGECHSMNFYPDTLRGRVPRSYLDGRPMELDAELAARMAGGLEIKRQDLIDCFLYPRVRDLLSNALSGAQSAFPKEMAPLYNLQCCYLFASELLNHADASEKNRVFQQCFEPPSPSGLMGAYRSSIDFIASRFGRDCSHQLERLTTPFGEHAMQVVKNWLLSKGLQFDPDERFVRTFSALEGRFLEDPARSTNTAAMGSSRKPPRLSFYGRHVRRD